jgi:hypothetical protein
MGVWLDALLLLLLLLLLQLLPPTATLPTALPTRCCMLCRVCLALSSAVI